MLDAWGDHPGVRDTLAEASAALGQDLGALIHAGPKEDLALTTNTQPVMLVAAVAAYRVWRAAGGAAPAFVAGHSLGEYSALVASGVLSLAQAVPLVRLRAQAMQEAVPVGTGAMAAVLGLPSDKVNAICQEAQYSFGAGSAEVVQAANFNDPGQTVISGSKAAVDKACELLKAAGAKRTLPLPVSAPFHCALMKPAAERLRVALASVDFHPPSIPLVNNIDVASPSGADDIRDARQRCIAVLLRLADCRHRDPAAPPTIIINHADLAAAANMSRHPAGEVLRELDSLGLIALGYGRVTIIDAAQLRAIVDGR
jgi:[acyl-carrier-protein] S-malonyltransferase